MARNRNCFYWSIPGNPNKFSSEFGYAIRHCNYERSFMAMVFEPLRHNNDPGKLNP